MIPSFMNQASRIIKGERAQGPIPWQVFWSYSNSLRCGGTILDRKTILSAAHCIDHNYQSLDISVRVGGTNILNQEQVIKVNSVIYNQEMPYSSETLDNDIILLKLKEPLEFNFFVQPACLPNEETEPEVNTRCLVSGWGTTSTFNPKYENNLRWADVFISDSNKCKAAYRQSQSPHQITNNMICAENFQGKDACQGDSGGPLICGQNGLPVLTGIVSFGEGCAKSNFPGVYTKVSRYLAWIRRHLESTQLTTTGLTGHLNQCGMLYFKYFSDFSFVSGLILAKLPSFMTEELSSVSARIVKGDNPPAPIPWQVGILSRRKNATQKQGNKIVFEPHCGGTILDEVTVLTAGHCFVESNIYPTPFVDRNVTNYLLVFATVKADLWKHQVMRPARIIVPDDYDPAFKLKNDLAIIKLEKPLVFNNNIQPACLPIHSYNPVQDENCFISGWGSTEQGISKLSKIFLKQLTFYNR